MKKPTTPFSVTGYYGPSYFCDRENETKNILENIRGGSSTILTAQRRIGKTSLIMHILAKLPKGTRGIYLDILPTENMNGFLNELASSVIKNIPDRKGFGKKIWDFIRSLRPTLTFDMLTGAPQVSFALKDQEVNRQIEAILQFLESQDEKIIIAIDEFQQILKYPEENSDAWFRSIIQKMKNVVFIFCGSQQHLMNELFTLPSRPFYNSARMLKIDKIDHKKYNSFILKKFSEIKMLVTENIVDQMLNWADDHTFYVQLICNRVFIRGNKVVNEDDWKEEADRLLQEQEPVFLNYRGMITSAQWNMLKASALENELYEPTGHEFISKHSLGNPATVLRTLQALLRMELIYFDYNREGRKYYKINDLLFRRWVETRDL
jgi:AAA+ ATPase superfamily predicted ATPase